MTKVYTGQLSNAQVDIYALKALEDNYIFMFVWENKAICIDPGQSKVVIDFINELNLELTAIFLTHFHHDHIDGVEDLINKYDCNVVGPASDTYSFIKQSVVANDEIITGPFVIQILRSPGHTPEHICYYFPEKHLLLAGDTIFGGGCGKILDGTPDELYSSLRAIAHLPQDTKIFYAHEYTLVNLLFAQSVDPDNSAIQMRYREEKEKLLNETPTVPSTLELELATNPFLRTKQSSIRKFLHMEDNTDLEVFTKLRALKDEYKAKDQ